MRNLLSFLLLLFTALPVQAGESRSVLVDFYAGWCAPCRAMAPTIDALAAAGYSVRRVDVDANRSLAARFHVERIPCFVAVEGGREIGRVVGPASYERLEAMLTGTHNAQAAKSLQPTPAWRYERATGHRAAVVRIVCRDGFAARSIGSGVLVRWGKRLVILTARHVIQDAKEIIVWFCTGKSCSARVLSADATWDVAVLEPAELPEGTTAAELEFGDDAMQREGNRLESCGYGPDGKLACNSGLFLGYRRPMQSPNGPDDWMVVSGHARGGDSGGPVFNPRGRVVGVLWGTDGQEVVCVQAGRIHALLDAALPPREFRQQALAIDTTMRKPTPVISEKPLIPIVEKPSVAAETCLPRLRGRIPAPSTTIVERDPEVRQALQSIDAKVGVLVERTEPKPAEKDAAGEEFSPLAAGLCVLGAVAAGCAIYFASNRTNG